MPKQIDKCMWKKGDTVRFTQERVEHAREGIGSAVPKWNKFVLENVNVPLTIKSNSVMIGGGNQKFPVCMIEEMRGYWDDSVFEDYDNFDEDLFFI